MQLLSNCKLPNSYIHPLLITLFIPTPEPTLQALTTSTVLSLYNLFITVTCIECFRFFPLRFTTNLKTFKVSIGTRVLVATLRGIAQEPNVLVCIHTFPLSVLAYTPCYLQSKQTTVINITLLSNANVASIPHTSPTLVN